MSIKRQTLLSANALIAETPNCLLSRVFEMNRNDHDEPHVHPWHQLLLPRTGMLRTRTPGDIYFVPSNRAAIIPAGTTHESWALTDTRFAGLYFEPTLYPAPLEQCRIIGLTPFLDALIGESLALGRNWLKPHGKPEKRMIAVLMDQLAASPEIDLSITVPDDKRLQPITEHLLTKPASRTSIAEWSRTVGASERTISRRFKQLTGLSFARWRQKVRMINALSMLEEGLPIQAIAHNVGYSSASAFIYAFRNEFGTTPQSYARRNQ